MIQQLNTVRKKLKLIDGADFYSFYTWMIYKNVMSLKTVQFRSGGAQPILLEVLSR